MQKSSPVAVGLFVCLQIRLEILAFGSLFAGIYGRDHRRNSGASKWQKNALRRTENYTNLKRLPCNRAMMHPYLKYESIVSPWWPVHIRPSLRSEYNESVGINLVSLISAQRGEMSETTRHQGCWSAFPHLWSVGSVGSPSGTDLYSYRSPLWLIIFRIVI